MKCQNCGNNLPEGASFCAVCGARQVQAQSSNQGTYNQGTYNQGSLNPSGGYYQQNPYGQNSTINLNQSVDDMNKKNANYLLEGERVIARANWNLIPFIIIWAVWFIYLIFVTSMQNTYSSITYYYNRGVSSITIIMWIVSIIVCLLSIFLFIARRELVVTNKKIYGRIGLIGTKQFIIPLNKVNYVSVRYTIIGRLLKSATFIVYPANALFGIMFMFVSNATEFRKAVEEEVYRYQK